MAPNVKKRGAVKAAHLLPFIPALAHHLQPYTILSLGLGVDSCALVTRWLLDPTSRDFPLDRLIVITAMTGDEFDDTRHLVETYILPLFRRFGIRYVQVARAGLLEKDGFIVLDDSRSPEKLYVEGAFKLSDELLLAGTIPQVAHGRRTCSIKAKGHILDSWIEENLAGHPYRHCIGFNADEKVRINRDLCYGSACRTPEHPLFEWGWTREMAWEYLMRTFGVSWPKSSCVYCPFSAGRPEVLARFRALPEAGLKALLIEYVSLSLNPRMTLYSRKSLYSCIQADNNHALLEEFENALNSFEWALYDVRRLLYSNRAVHRKVVGIARGSRREMAELLAERAGRAGIPLSHEAGMPRLHLVPRQPGVYPSAEQMLVTAPAFPIDKARPSFEKGWQKIFPAAAPLVQLEKSAA